MYILIHSLKILKTNFGYGHFVSLGQSRMAFLSKVLHVTYHGEVFCEMYSPDGAGKRGSTRFLIVSLCKPM